MYLMIAQYRYRYRKSGKIYWLIPAIGISAKSHIGASLIIIMSAVRIPRMWLSVGGQMALGLYRGFVGGGGGGYKKG